MPNVHGGKSWEAAMNAKPLKTAYELGDMIVDASDEAKLALVLTEKCHSRIKRIFAAQILIAYGQSGPVDFQL